MKNIHQPIKDILSYYANILKNERVIEILNKESIDSKNEAKELYLFLEPMCNKIAEDAKNGTTVLRQPIHTTDAEKICNIIEDYIEEIGYENLIS